jgi:hypothetical protein
LAAADDEVDLKYTDLLKRSHCCCRQPQNLLILSMKFFADLVDENFADLVDEKVEGSRPDNKIQSPRSPQSAPIDEG